MRYFKQIDGLRFVAIFLVLIEHFTGNLHRYISAGYYGVDLFFVISGFLITSILFQTPDVTFSKNFKNFIGRRVLRIFPIYYLTIILVCLSDFANVKDKIIWVMTYTYNYGWVYLNYPDSPFTHFWSLGVEEQFYLFWPLVILLLRKVPKTLLVVILFIILLGYSQFYFNIFPMISKYNSISLITRMSSLGIGAFGAIYSLTNKLPDKLFENKYIEILILSLLVISLFTTFMIKPVVLALVSVFIVLKASYYNFKIVYIDKFLRNKMVAYIGTISYGIYVYHVPLSQYFNTNIFEPMWSSFDFSILGVFERIRYNRWIVQFPLYSILSVIIAAISYKFIEIPILNLKDKYFKRT